MGAESPHKVRVIHAYPADVSNRRAELPPLLQNLTRAASMLIDEAARDGDARAALRVACDGQGRVDISSVRLVTPSALASFSTIVLELKTAGFDDPRVKYLVFYDGPAPCMCAGMANLRADDRPGPENLNNGNRDEPMFAILFEDAANLRTWLHELLHTMGAVQHSAPHATGAGHCTDGRDIVCSYDAGPGALNYTLGICEIEVVDCGRDDYFSAAPGPGAYLATRWNLAAATNRFLDSDWPWIHHLDCPGGTQVAAPVTCELGVTDDTSRAVLRVDWGDGHVHEQEVHGETRLALGHRYDAVGVWVVAVTVSNAAGQVREARTSLRSWADADPPDVQLLVPEPARVYRGCHEMTPLPQGPALFLQRLCVRLETRDSGSGLASLRVLLGDEEFVLDPSVESHRVELQTWGRPGRAEVVVEAMDRAGNRAIQEASVILV